MTKNGSSGAKSRARGRQDRTGSNYTTARRAAGTTVCGKPLDPWAGAIFIGSGEGGCARPPHPTDEPCSSERSFSVAAWRTRMSAEEAAERARWDALTPEQQDEEEERARQEVEADIMAAERAGAGFDKYYGDEG